MTSVRAREALCTHARSETHGRGRERGAAAVVKAERTVTPSIRARLVGPEGDVGRRFDVGYSDAGYGAIEVRQDHEVHDRGPEQARMTASDAALERAVLQAIDMDQRVARRAVRGVLAVVDAGIERRERALEVVVRTIGQVA